MNRKKYSIKCFTTLFIICTIVLGYLWIFDIEFCVNAIIMAIILALPVTICEILEI